MQRTVVIEMHQGYDDKGQLITHVPYDYQYRKYQGMTAFIPYGAIVRLVARFTVRYSIKKYLWESEHQFEKRIENILYNNLEIYNVNQK